MKYSTRNSIVLIGVWFLIVIISSAILLKTNSELKSFLKDINELRAQKTTLENNKLLLNKENLEKRLKIEMEKNLRNNKIILKEEDSKITYKYFTMLNKMSRNNSNFNFQYIENKKDNKNPAFSNYKKNSYTIEGSAPANGFYQFISNIETQQPLYTVEKLQVEEFSDASYNNEKPNYVYYKAEITGYSIENGIPLEQIHIEPKMFYLPHNLFKTRIHPPIMDEKQLQYLDTDTAILLGLTSDIATLTDDSGRIFYLKVNDKVAYGYLSNIQFENQSVTFMVNKIGLYKKKTIKLEINVLKDKD